MAIASDMQRRFVGCSRRRSACSPVRHRCSGRVEELDRVVAIVDDDIVTATELLERLSFIERRFEQGDGNCRPAMCS